jgi:glycosyltransferase involved in cell wall biosynthesis
MVRPQGGQGLNKSVLFVGTCYYNAWYLSRALRERGWRATVATFPGDMSETYGHGWDVRFDYHHVDSRVVRLVDLLRRSPKVLSLFLSHKVIHFTGVHNLRMLHYCYPPRWPTETGTDIRWLRRLGKKIVYSHTGCLDGVSQTSFSGWGLTPVCNDCAWQHVPTVCSDERNLRWGRLRNSLCDYQVSMGGNRVDYNDDPRIHEVQQFYCLDPNVWRPDLPIPDEHRLVDPAGKVRIYHSVGNYDLRTNAVTKVNVKSTHIYAPLIERMRADGMPVELVFVRDKSNLDVRYYQAQSDIICESLTFGFFGANVREALMLGKPVICYLRPEWLESIRREQPDFVAELPVINATPQTVEAILTDLVRNPEKRREIGRRGREFAVKWYSAKNAAAVFDRIYSDLITGRNGSDHAELLQPDVTAAP